MELSILYYLIPSLIMFGAGVYGFITRKNLIAILITLELMLNAVDIQPFPFPGSVGRNVLHIVCNCHSRSRNSISNSHYHQYFPCDEEC